MQTFKSKLLYTLTVFTVGIISGALINQIINNRIIIQDKPTINDQAKIKPNNQAFDWLNIPVEYFSKNDLRWGSSINRKGEKITDYKNIALNNKAIYQSYPTTITTIKDYSSEIKPLKKKSYNEIMEDPFTTNPDGWWKTRIEENYQKYGTLAANYLPLEDIETLKKFDVDDDGISETIVSYNSVGMADAGSYRSDIIKGNNIIFSVQEDNAGIIPADTTNGFYVEWRSSLEMGARCCPEGFMRARFVFKDGKFIPLFEQEIKYLKIGEGR